MSSRRRIAMAVLTASLAAGCGGGGAEDGPSKSQYIARADRICAATREAAAPLVERVASAGTSLSERRARRLASVMDQLHGLGVRYRSDLAALERPARDGEAIDAFLTPTGHVVDAVGEGRAALARGNVAGALLVLARARTLDEQAAAAAEDYGFAQCGSVISEPS